MSAATTAGVAAVHAVVGAFLMLALGYLVADLLLGAKSHRTSLRLALAFPAAFGCSILLMVAHLVTGGGVFSRPGAVRFVWLASLTGLLLIRVFTRKRFDKLDRRELYLGLGLALAATALWCSPLLRTFPVPLDRDTQLHAGWTNQLLNGQPTPTTVVTGDVPNYYPWGFHAFSATATALVPGDRALHGAGAVQVAQVAGLALALFGLGSALGGLASGAGVAMLGSLAGGFGFVAARGADVVLFAEDNLRYGGDLMFWRSYNATMHNLPPPYPRDVAFVLLIALCTCLVMDRTSEGRRWLLPAGAILGAIGLTGGEAFIVAAFLAISVALFPPKDVRRRVVALVVFVPALAIYLLWLGPVVVNYIRLGGFVDTTHIEPVVLPLWATLVSWGVVTPLALTGGVLLCKRRATTGYPVVVGFVSAALLGLILAPVVPKLLGEEFDTLGRQHRYWPLLFLSLAVLGGIAFEALGSGRARVTALGACALFALPSPLLVATALPREFARFESADRTVGAAMRDEPEGLLNVLAPVAGSRCAVAAPPELTRWIFAHTGYRMVRWVGGAEGENEARIRWKDIYTAMPDGLERKADNETLLESAPEELVQKYGVDAIVVEAGHEPTGSEFESAMVGVEAYSVVRFSDCGARTP